MWGWFIFGGAAGELGQFFREEEMWRFGLAGEIYNKKSLTI